MAQLGLSQLKQPDFTEKVVTALNQFLKDPHSMTFAVRPQPPLDLQKLMSLDKTDPAAAIGLFGVTVTAND
jgi:hypothetical protein